MNRIKELRKSMGLTQNDVGESLGICSNTLSQYETATRDPNSETWHKLAQYFDVTIGYLMGYEDRKDDFIYLNEAFAGIVWDMRKIPNADVMIVLDGKPLYNNAQGFVDAYLHPELVKITKL